MKSVRKTQSELHFIKLLYLIIHCTHLKLQYCSTKLTKRVCSCFFSPNHWCPATTTYVLQVYSTSSQTCTANTALLCIMTSWRIHTAISEVVTELNRGTPVWWNVSETHWTLGPPTLHSRCWLWQGSESGLDAQSCIGCNVCIYPTWYIQLLSANCCYGNSRLSLQHNTPPLYTEAVWSRYAHLHPHLYPHPLTPTPSHTLTQTLPCPHPNTSISSHTHFYTLTLSHTHRSWKGVGNECL